MDNQPIRYPSHCGHCSYLPGNMNMLPHMPMMPSMASNPWSPWHVPYMNMPSMPFMSPVPNILHDPMDLMRQNMNVFQQKTNLMGMFPNSQDNLNNTDKSSQRDAKSFRNHPKRSGLVKNGYSKSHHLQEEYKQRRKSLPSEHDMVPDFDDHSKSAENFSELQSTKQKAFESDTLSADIMSKSADEGYASYQKTYKDPERDSVSSGNGITKLENYTKSPPMRRKSLPTASEIDNEPGNLFSSEVFIHPIHANHSVPAFQTHKHQYQENAYKERVNKSNDLAESLYSIDMSDDDDDIFDSSLEGKLFVVNCSLAPLWK